MMANNEKIYITGATGRLGSAVLTKLTAKGIESIPLVRKPSQLKNEKVTDFSEKELVRILEDARVIIHIAGSVETYDKKKLREANVELTQKIINSAPSGSRIIFASSISVYGKHLENPANEKTKTNPDSDYSRSKYDAEKLVANYPDHVILRIGTVYGPQFSDYAKILRKIRQEKMTVIGDGKNHIPFVHVDDVAEAFLAAAEGKGNGTYVVVGDPLKQNEIYTIAARAMNVRPPKKHMPVALAMAIAWFGELLTRISRRKPGFSREHVSVLAYDREFDCSKAKKELGFKPRPLENGIESMITELEGQL